MVAARLTCASHLSLSNSIDAQPRAQNIDLLTLFLLGSQLVLFVSLSRPVARVFFGLYFALWRLAYDAGLGYVLRRQSEHRWIVKTVRREGWFDLDRRPAVAKWARSELRKKMGNDYNFEVGPPSSLRARVSRTTRADPSTRAAECPARVQRQSLSLPFPC